MKKRQSKIERQIEENRREEEEYGLIVVEKTAKSSGDRQCNKIKENRYSGVKSTPIKQYKVKYRSRNKIPELPAIIIKVESKKEQSKRER